MMHRTVSGRCATVVPGRPRSRRVAALARSGEPTTLRADARGAAPAAHVPTAVHRVPPVTN